MAIDGRVICLWLIRERDRLQDFHLLFPAILVICGSVAFTVGWLAAYVVNHYF